MFVITLEQKQSLKKTGAGGHVLCPGGVQRAAGALHQHPHGDGCGVSEQDRERTGHPDLVHRLRAGGGRCVHHRRQSQDPRKWDDSFSAFNGVVQQSGMDLTRCKGKTVKNGRP